MTNLKPRVVYLLLLAVQIAGALFIVVNGLPEFRQLVVHPGEQLPYEPYYDDPATIGTVIAMQAAYWYRLQCIPIPSQSSNAILNHLLLFLGALPLFSVPRCSPSSSSDIYRRSIIKVPIFG